MIKRIQALFVIVCFGCNLGFPSFSFASSQTILNLPAPGTMLSTSPAFVPAMVKGIQIDPKNPLKFNFIVDTGDTNLTGEKLKEESAKLIKYFLAALTVPEKDLWVNLSPYEKDRIIAQGLGQTEMGRDMLAQDYILKQLTASLIYPENGLGKAFWAKVYSKAQQKYGTTNIPVNTFNKVWIMPDHATIYEHNGTAYVLENKLKVMLEQDYLSMSKHANVGVAEGGASPSKAQAFASNPGSSNLTYPQNKAIGTYGQDPNINALGSQIVREMVLPQLEKEVNQGRNFASLRQIADAVVLATWYKQNLMNSLLGQVYANQNKVKGVDVQDKNIKMKIYQQYLQAFKKGAYNYIKEDFDPVTNTTVPRKYFSGGLEMTWHPGENLATVFVVNPKRVRSVHTFKVWARLPALFSPGTNNAMLALDTIVGKETFDSRGNPTVEADVILAGGIKGSAKVPSGASTGKHEAVELRDNDPNYKKGKGVYKAISNVNEIILPALKAANIDIMAPDALEQADNLMRRLDGTPNKSRLGANAILSISMAYARAAAAARGLRLSDFLNQEKARKQGKKTAQSMPVPMLNVINGGAHVQAAKKADVQEYMIMPVGATSEKEALDWSKKVFQTLGEILTERGMGPKDEFDYGNEKGYKPALESNEQGLEFLMQAIKRAGFEPGKQIAIALDVASTEFYNEDTKTYKFEGKDLTANQMIGIYLDWANKYPIVSIEDGLAEDDWGNWSKLTEAIDNREQLVGDDLFVTNPTRLQRGIKEGAANAILIKVNQIGTVSETLDVIIQAEEAGYGVIISHRSGETEDAFISDLAVGTGAGQIKTGGLAHWPAVEATNRDAIAGTLHSITQGRPTGMERMAKYNRLEDIEEQGIWVDTSRHDIVYAGLLPNKIGDRRLFMSNNAMAAEEEHQWLDRIKDSIDDLELGVNSASRREKLEGLLSSLSDKKLDIGIQGEDRKELKRRIDDLKVRIRRVLKGKTDFAMTTEVIKDFSKVYGVVAFEEAWQNAVSELREKMGGLTDESLKQEYNALHLLWIQKRWRQDPQPLSVVLKIGKEGNVYKMTVHETGSELGSSMAQSGPAAEVTVEFNMFAIVDFDKTWHDAILQLEEKLIADNGWKTTHDDLHLLWLKEVINGGRPLSVIFKLEEKEGVYHLSMETMEQRLAMSKGKPYDTAMTADELPRKLYSWIDEARNNAIAMRAPFRVILKEGKTTVFGQEFALDYTSQEALNYVLRRTELSGTEAGGYSYRPVNGNNLDRRYSGNDLVIFRSSPAMTTTPTSLLFNKITPEQESWYEKWDRTLGKLLMAEDGDFTQKDHDIKLGPIAETAVEVTVHYFNSVLVKGSEEQRYFYEWVLGQPSSLLSAFVLARLGLEAYEPFFFEKLRDIALNNDPFGNPRSAARQIIEMAEKGTIGGKQVSAETQMDAKKLLKERSAELYDLAKPQIRHSFSGKLRGVLFMQRNEPTEEMGFFRMGGWRGARTTEEGIKKLTHNGEILSALSFQFAASADLARNIDTMEAVRKGHGSIPEDYARAWELRDKSYGFVTGFNRDDAARLYGDSYEFWRKESTGRPPGGESYEDVKERLDSYVVNVIVPALERGENVFIAANGNSMRAITEIIGENTNREYKLPLEKIKALESKGGLEIGIRFDPGTSKPIEYWATNDKELTAAVDALAEYSHNSAMTIDDVKKRLDQIIAGEGEEARITKINQGNYFEGYMEFGDAHLIVTKRKSKGTTGYDTDIYFYVGPWHLQKIVGADIRFTKKYVVGEKFGSTDTDNFLKLLRETGAEWERNSADAAMGTTVLERKSNEGGINLDPAMNSILIKRDGNGMPLPVWQQSGRMINVGGFGVEIMSVTPIKDLPVFLGAAK